jgi:RNA polymerase sigma factor (sigma-70 family)
MAHEGDGTILQFLRQLMPSGGGPSADGDLLARFVAGRDPAAFEALVRRHGPMVWGVCLRMLADPTDAEDAFQATFLVLARRAGAVGRRELLANWLYGVARRAALKARGRRARRRAHERQVATMTEPLAAGNDSWATLRPDIDAELARLADKYRLPVLLCYLEGHTRDEAARVLGWPPGTVAGRLSRALALLRTRLARRGVGLTALALTAALAENGSAAVPPHLLSAVTEAAPLVAAGGLTAAGVSASAITLSQEVLKPMTATKLVLALAALLAIGLVASGAAALAPALAGRAGTKPTSADQGAPAKDPEPSKAAAEFEALKAKYEKAVEDYRRKITTATEEERRALSQDTPNTRYIKLFNDLAEKYSTDAVAFDILVYARRHANGPIWINEDWDRTQDLLARHFAADGRMKDLVPTLRPWGEADSRLLRAVLDKHPDKVTRARACKELLRLRQYDVTGAQEYIDKPQIRRNLEQRTPNGVAYYRDLLANLERNKKEVDELTKLTKDRYAGVLPEVAWNRPVPDAELTDLDGKKYKLSDFRGKLVILNFFAADKPGPLDTVLMFQAKHARMYKDKLVVFNVGLDEQKETFQEFLKKNPTPAINCWAGSRSEFAYDWTGERHQNPDSILIDPDGIYHMQGVFSYLVEDFADKLLCETAARGRGVKATPVTEGFVALRKEFDRVQAEEAEKQRQGRPSEVPDTLDKAVAYWGFPKKLNDLAEKYPDDPASFQVLRYNLIEYGGFFLENRAQIERSLTLLAKHHAAHSDMGDFLRSLPRLALVVSPDLVPRLARAVADKNRDPAARARGYRLLVKASEAELSLAQYYLEHPEHREALEKERPDGRAYFKELTGRTDAIKKEIADYQRLLKEKYADALPDDEK